MQNEFEDKLKQEMETFSIQPGQQVWREINLLISKQKRRKRVLAIWFLFGLLLFSGVAYFGYINFEGTNASKNIIAKNSASYLEEKGQDKNSKPVDSINLLNNKRVQNASAKQQGNNQILDSDKEIADNKVDKRMEDFNVKQLGKGRRFSKNANLEVVQSVKPLGKKQEEIVKDDSQNQKLKNNHPNAKAIQIDEEKINNSMASNNDVEQVGNNADTIHNVQLINDVKATGEKDTVANTQLITALPKKVAKKANWKFGFSASLGISDNVMTSTTIVRNASASFSQTVNAPFSQSGITGSNYESGLSYGTGIFAKRRVANRVSISVGLNYHYYSAQANVASKIDSVFSIYDAGLNTTSSVSTYYTAGNNFKYLNKYHLFHLPINLIWDINSKKNSSITAFAGLSPSVLAATNALYQNQNNGLIYKEIKQFYRFNLFMQGGLLFPLKNNIHIGPVIHYSITNFSKSSTNTNQNLFFTGITANYSLK